MSYSPPSSDAERDEFASDRRRMLERHLQQRGIVDPRVLHALGAVPRECFVPPDLHERAYDDRALPIGQGQTISQPYTVAFMCQALGLTGTEKVLEVGTGSGYGAAVLSHLARQVHSVERISELGDVAAQRLADLGYANVAVQLADGAFGLPSEAPFDAIVVTAGAARLPQAYVEQLAPGGRIVIPIGERPHSQTMFRFTLRDGQLESEDLGDFAFVPLVSESSAQVSDSGTSRRIG